MLTNKFLNDRGDLSIEQYKAKIDEFMSQVRPTDGFKWSYDPEFETIAIWEKDSSEEGLMVLKHQTILIDFNKSGRDACNIMAPPKFPKVKLGFKKLDPRAQLPKYAHEGDAGMDIFALDDVELPLYTPTMVHTGIAAEIPDGYEIQVRPRSGLACKGVTVWNSPGTVDSKYRGEICVILMYIHSEVETRTEKQVDPRTGQWIDVGVGTQRKMRYNVKAGDKIAQLVLAPVTFADPYEVEGELSETDRGTGGFGSTGR